MEVRGRIPGVRGGWRWAIIKLRRCIRRRVRGSCTRDVGADVRWVGAKRVGNKSREWCVGGVRTARAAGKRCGWKARDRSCGVKLLEGGSRWRARVRTKKPRTETSVAFQSGRKAEQAKSKKPKRRVAIMCKVRRGLSLLGGWLQRALAFLGDEMRRRPFEMAEVGHHQRKI